MPSIWVCPLYVYLGVFPSYHPTSILDTSVRGNPAIFGVHTNGHCATITVRTVPRIGIGTSWLHTPRTPPVIDIPSITSSSIREGPQPHLSIGLHETTRYRTAWLHTTRTSSVIGYGQFYTERSTATSVNWTTRNHPIRNNSVVHHPDTIHNWRTIDYGQFYTERSTTRVV